ncbi:MAG TPA: hypothetical protein EYH04_05555 [Archaeoglobus profundus]|nr:hypothetical protein [Archaeoglobus profundus]
MNAKLTKLLLIITTLLVATQGALGEEIKIGVLADLSGPLATYGKQIKDTLKIAEEDINAYFKERNLTYEVKFYFEDTKADPTIALRKVQSLHARGIVLIVGPMGSGEVKNIKEYVTENKIIIISPSSTAIPSIIGCTKPEEKRYIFRFVATDDLQSKVIADMIKESGIKGVVITYLGNAWGKGLCDEVKNYLEKYGIEVAEVVEYPDPPPPEFSPYIAKIESGVKELLKKYNRSEVAIVAFSYEEVFTIMAQTPKDSVLFDIIWFGSDGCAKSEKAKDVCDRVTRVGLYSTVFESRGPAYENLVKKFKERGFGESPYQYALNAYDAAWVLALAYVELMEEKGKYDPDAMVEKIRQVTENYSKGVYGIEPVSGVIELNEWNDRASGDFAIYYVTSKCEWDKAGIWKFETGKIEWFHKPEPPEKVVTPTPEEETPGFEAIIAIAVLAVVYIITRRL